MRRHFDEVDLDRVVAAGLSRDLAGMTFGSERPRAVDAIRIFEFMTGEALTRWTMKRLFAHVDVLVATIGGTVR